MATLNREAADALRAAGGVHGCTDITGFSLIGHASEMAEASGVTLLIDVSRVPMLPGALELADDNRTGGGANNARHFGPRVVLHDVSAAQASVLYDPQTSGGLLASIDAASVPAARAAFAERGIEAHLVGVVRARDGADGPLLHAAQGLPTGQK